MNSPHSSAPATTPVLAVIRAAGPQAAIAGGPTALLQTGDGTLLQCALRKARALGSDLGPSVGDLSVVVTVRQQHGPVVAQARREGARLLIVPTGTPESEAWILDAVQREGWAPGGARMLLLRVDAPLVTAATLERLAQAEMPAPVDASASNGLVPVLEEEARPDPERAGIVRLDLPAYLPAWKGQAAPGVEGPGAPLPEPIWRPLVVTDRFVNVRLRDVATYRRHFPEAFRRRFQKW
jgi:CTP:molybdopterin cytidylyltransferase MocA